MLKICKTLNCNNRARISANYCYKCKSKKYRKNNTLKYIYNILKESARRRGIEFKLTVDDIKTFTSNNPDYLNRKGQKSKDLTIDRINELKGYELNNLQVLTRKENTAKYQKFKIGLDNNNYPF